MAISTFDDARAAVAGGMAAVDAARELVASLTPEERLWCLDGDLPALAGVVFQLHEGGYHRMISPAARLDRVGIPGIGFSDGPRGAVVGNATAFPVSMARGATWDPDLEERVGDAIGRELRAVGANFTGAVCINLLRHPAWGRAQETYGEDPHHVGEMGAAFTRGLQRHVLACVKHFACNSMENARFTVDIEIDDVALHEVFLPHFRRVVDEGVASIMSAYNSVNGAWCGQNRILLTEVLRDEWGFEGFVISDFIFGLRDAGASLRAGLDIEMPFRMLRMQQLPDALRAGDVTWDEVAAAATRVIATLLRFDDVLSAPSPGTQVLGSEEHRVLAREVAARSVVLLRNELVDEAAVLPLDPGQSLAVIGGLAATVNLGDGGSSDVWDLDCQTVLDGIRAAAVKVTYDDGTDVARAAAVAADVDAALIVVGYTHLDEGEFIGALDPALTALFPPEDEPEVVARLRADIDALPETVLPPRLKERPRGFSSGGDRQSLRLKSADVELIRAVAATNLRTIVALQAGSAVVMTEWIDAVPAVVQSWYAGSRAGDGLADVLFGAVNPSARLPFSVPVDEADLPAFERDATRFRYDRWHGWWHLSRSGAAPAFPFGFGLSYTTFQITDVSVEQSGDSFTIHGSVANTGDRDGADVVQVYAELPDPDAPPRLVGLQRVEVAAGASTEFTIVVAVGKLATRDSAAGAWRPPTGRHRIRVAHSATDRSTPEVELVL
jgi:beta-glucosidase